MSHGLVSRLKSCAKDCTMLGDEVDAAFFNEATAAITAYLAQAGKEGWVMVPRADIVEVRESMEQMDGTFDPETSDYALYHRLDVLLHPELIGYAAAQNGGEPCK